jgi:DNA-binding HxlR family transcriptional regulator
MALKRRKNTAPQPPCPLNECMSLIVGAWTPHILWYLSQGPRRFSELKADMPSISAKVLSTRLKELEERGIVDRKVMPTSPPSVEYQMTELGSELIPAISAIVDVSHKLRMKALADGDVRHRRAYAIVSGDLGAIEEGEFRSKHVFG